MRGAHRLPRDCRHDLWRGGEAPALRGSGGRQQRRLERHVHPHRPRVALVLLVLVRVADLGDPRPVPERRHHTLGLSL